MDTADTCGVLCGERRDDARPITVQRGERLQVRLKQAPESVHLSKMLGRCRVDLDASTSRRIASSDGQYGR